MSKVLFWPTAIVKTRVPVSIVVPPAGNVGSVGIGGSDRVGPADAVGDAVRGGVAVADAVAAGVSVGRALVEDALVDAGGVALREADADVPGTFRSASAPQALSVVASRSVVASHRLRG